MRPGRRLDRILDAGAEVLAERGFHGCTMRDVAARGRVSVANLYRYVRGKEELLYLVQERVLERAIRSAEAARALRGGREQLKSFVTDHVRRALANPAEALILQDRAPELPEPLRSRLDEKRAAYMDLACGIVEGAANAHGVRRSTLERRVHLLLAMADRVALLAVQQEAAPRPDRLARPVLEMFLRGVKG
jgi:AcrR family transcriptional regulator